MLKTVGRDRGVVAAAGAFLTAALAATMLAGTAVAATPAPPTVTFDSPAQGATVTAGSYVVAGFHCTEGAGGPGIKSCLGPNGPAPAETLYTNTTGRFTYTVTATSQDGQTATGVLTYNVAAASGSSGSGSGSGGSGSGAGSGAGSSGSGGSDGAGGPNSGPITILASPGPSRPAIAIAAPIGGRRYARGQMIDAGYGCEEGWAGPGLASCQGPVSDGSAIDTGTLGVHHFTVVATSSDGQLTTRTVTYTVYSPENHFSILDVRVHRDGAVHFKLRLPGRGRADVLETGWLDNFAKGASLLAPAPQRFVFARAHLRIERSGTISVAVTPGRSGRRLIAHHRYTVVLRLWVSFIPTLGTQRNVGVYGLRVGS